MCFRVSWKACVCTCVCVCSQLCYIVNISIRQPLLQPNIYSKPPRNLGVKNRTLYFTAPGQMSWKLTFKLRPEPGSEIWVPQHILYSALRSCCCLHLAFWFLVEVSARHSLSYITVSAFNGSEEMYSSSSPTENYQAMVLSVPSRETEPKE